MTWSPNDLDLPQDERRLRKFLRHCLRMRNRFQRGKWGWAAYRVLAIESIARLRRLRVV